MATWFAGGVICMLVGLLLIGSTFYVQKQEDKERLPGYYTTGTIVANKPGAEKSNMRKREVTFEFTKDFQVLRCTNSYPEKDAENWKVGRNTLIVYDEVADMVYYNPMKKSRQKQAVLMSVGGIVLLAGIYWSIAVCGLMMQ